MAPTGVRKTKGDASLGPKAARVEAIFLSPDPEEGSCEASRELWRQAKAVQIGNRILPGGDKRLSNAKTTVNTHPSNYNHLSEPSGGGGLSAKRGLPPLLLPGSERDIDTKGPRPKTTQRATQRVKTAAAQRPGRSGRRPNPRRYSDCSSGLSSRGGSVSSGGRESTTGSSRRSSAASLQTMSSPESPASGLEVSNNSPRRKRFHFSRRYGNTLTLEDPSEEFVRLRKTATTVHSATRFRSSTDRGTDTKPRKRGSRPASAASHLSTESHPGRFRSWSSAFHQASRKHRRRSRSTSPSTALQLTLPDGPGGESSQRKNSSSDTAEEPARDGGSSSRKSSRSSAASFDSRHRRLSVFSAFSPRDIQVTASRPSSALSTRSRSGRPRSATAFNAVSRPWTPSPSHSASPGSHRGYSQSRVTTAAATLVPPLQALNRKVRGILGCAAAILEIYTKRPAASDPQPKTKSFAQRPNLPERKNLKPTSSDKKTLPNESIRSRTLPNITPVSKSQNPKNAKAVLPHAPITEPVIKKPSETQVKVKLPQPSLTRNKASIAPLTTTKRPTPETSRTAVHSAPAVKPSKSNQMARFKTASQPSATNSAPPRPAPPRPKRSPTANPRKLEDTETGTSSSNRPRPPTGTALRSASPNRPPSPLFVRKHGGGVPQMSTFLQKARNARGRRIEVRPQQREQFVDKDRAAAVVLGDSDIKTTLEKQTKKDRGRYVLPKESPAQVYLAQAEFELRVGGLNTALRLLDKALELQPGDKVALVSRSRCRLLLGDATGALQDAEEALETDKTFVKAIYQKAEVLYHMGEFENALVFFHLGLKQRPDMETFQSGVRKAQEAIEISLGVKPPRAGQAGSRVSKTNNWMTKKANNKATSQVCPPLQLNSTSAHDNAAATDRSAKNKKNKEEARLLGELHVDKLYLEKLLKSPSLRHVDSGKSHHLVSQAQEALRFLESRQEFWRQQQPVHLPRSSSPRKKGRGHRSTSRNPRRKPVSQTPSQSTPDDLDSGYADVPHADLPNPEELLQDDPAPLITLVAKELDSISEPEKLNLYDEDTLLTRMHKALDENELLKCVQLYLESQKLTYQPYPPTGQNSPQNLHGHFFGNDFSPSDSKLEGRQLSEPNLLNDSSPSTLRTPDLGATPTSTLAPARRLSVSNLPHIEQLEAQIPHLRQPTERCHLFLELGARYLSYGKGETAKFYGRQSLDGAQMSKDQQCSFQACLLMAAADAYCEKLEYSKERLLQASQYLEASRMTTPHPNHDSESPNITAN